MFSCTTGEKLPSWCLLMWTADCCLVLCLYTESHFRGWDTSNSRYWLLSMEWQIWGATRCSHGTRHTVQTEENINICCRNRSVFEFCVKLIDCYSNLLIVLLALHINHFHNIRYVVFILQAAYSINSRSTMSHNNQPITAPFADIGATLNNKCK